MTALDSSVSVPDALPWHEAHELCRGVARSAAIPSHALAETYSVLTRLPTPHRLAHDVAADYLARRFTPAAVLAAPAGLQRSLVVRLAAVGIAGGAVFDAIVGLTAAAHGELLLTRDLRAVRTYELLGIDHRVVGEPSLRPSS